MKKKQFWLWLLPTLLWIGLIFFQSSRTATQSDDTSLGLLALVQRLLPFMTNSLLRKLAHFTEFAILGLLLAKTCTYTKDSTLLRPSFFGILTALCDETIQLFVPGRSGNLRDVWIDLAGVFVGVLLLWLPHRLRRKGGAKSA